jgi:hypothetical protein
MSQFMVVNRPATYDEDGTLLEPALLRLDYASKVSALALLLKCLGLLDGKACSEAPVKALVGVDLGRV